MTNFQHQLWEEVSHFTDRSKQLKWFCSLQFCVLVNFLLTIFPFAFLNRGSLCKWTHSGIGFSLSLVHFSISSVAYKFYVCTIWNMFQTFASMHPCSHLHLLLMFPCVQPSSNVHILFLFLCTLSCFFTTRGISLLLSWPHSFHLYK
jgi:uncharacterized BrkB/YihY/UPF0761 family membrane protein